MPHLIQCNKVSRAYSLLSLFPIPSLHIHENKLNDFLPAFSHSFRQVMVRSSPMQSILLRWWK